MEIYLVGGAVRDQLLGLPVKEKDWVVVGATVDEMLQKGFRQVGKDFPVFLHPETNEEYALARMERKVGRGYTGFDFDASPNVTLEEDLLRRDLTINAMAEKTNGELVDPCHGADDLENKLLRHVSPAFVEDPVRVLRVARFAARFASLGFTVAPETNVLMKEMVKSGEVDALVAERVWKELERALQEKVPQQFFQVLANCDALSVLFPVLNQQRIDFLQQAASLTEDPEIRFSVLLHALSKDDIQNLCDRYRVPNPYRELAVLVATHYSDYPRVDELSASEVLEFIQAADAFRREARFKKLLMASEAIFKSAVKTERWFAFYNAAKSINTKELASKTTDGKEIAKLVHQKRLESIEKILNSP